MSGLVGTTIGKYQIESFLGRGAMAEVYEGYHPHLDRRVAIKVLHPFLSEKTGILDRFRREAKHIAALSHPNIVRVYDFDVEGNTYYMVMELLQGQTLKHLLQDTKQKKELIPLQEVIRIIQDLAKALDYAHQLDVVHRDVKPANVMMSAGKRVVLMDFGLARMLGGQQFTQTGAMVGTPAYISPEQGQGEAGDNRSDIYSLGVMLYQMATGQLPFFAEGPMAIIYKHVNAPVPVPRSINGNLPEPLEKIILETLEKKASQRYQSVRELYRDLSKIELGGKSSSRLTATGGVQPFFSSTLGLTTVSLAMIESGTVFPLENKKEFTIGRLDRDVNPDVDTGPFDGFSNGVSRLHAMIRIGESGRITLTDLGSTNGTSLNGKKLSASMPESLHNGDVIGLGKLMVQVLIRS